MPGTTTNLAIPYPLGTEVSDGAGQMQALAERVDSVLGPGAGVPIGTLVMWATGTAPAMWLLCIGQTNISATEYPKLAAVLGSSGGFVTMPNFVGRFPCAPGQAAQGAANEQASNGAGPVTAGGKAKHRLLSSESGMPGHTHTDNFSVTNAGAIATGTESADHTHNYTYHGGVAAAVQGQAGGVNVLRHGYDGAAGSGPRNTAHSHTLPAHGHGLAGDVLAIAAQDAGGAPAPASAYHENRPPFMTVNFIIRADK